ncbi:NADP-dependent oxidoreductase domain-containing protein [Mycena albidolilacea]|uniref:NADP-dependent oxidoreductase domain-containing protein n=1 Tax=Mycena albidolilacea TaxID=1033008 RepID=A0AAD6ZBH2_9AGAR|nr:NADP-dependent oxidoreductase domain-containing protein [Mycena albidolilacea]
MEKPDNTSRRDRRQIVGATLPWNKGQPVAQPSQCRLWGRSHWPRPQLGLRRRDSIEKAYKLLEEGGCDTIDTVRLYGSSEEWIGKTGGGKRFTIDSKTPGGFAPGTSTSDTIPQFAEETVERLGVKSVDVYYIHAPDPSVELEDQLKGINDAYKAGYFKRFGLSCARAPRMPVALPRATLCAECMILCSTSHPITKHSGCGRKRPRKLGAVGRSWLIAGWLSTRPSIPSTATLIFGASTHTQISETLAWLKHGSMGEAAKAKIDEIWSTMHRSTTITCSLEHTTILPNIYLALSGLSDEHTAANSGMCFEGFSKWVEFS